MVNAATKIFSDLILRMQKNNINQKDYKEDMLNKVEPYLKKNLKNGYILGKKNLKIY